MCAYSDDALQGVIVGGVLHGRGQDLPLLLIIAQTRLPKHNNNTTAGESFAILSTVHSISKKRFEGVKRSGLKG